MKEIIKNKYKQSALIILNLTRNVNFSILPGNLLPSENSTEYSLEETNQVRKLYQTIPGYEFISEFTYYSSEEESFTIRKQLIHEYKILEMIDKLCKPEAEYTDSIIAETILNLSEVNELKRTLIQHGYLKKLCDLYYNSKSRIAKIHASESLARLLINTTPSLSEFQVEEYAGVLLSTLKETNNAFYELLHFECCMALSYLATTSTNAEE